MIEQFERLLEMLDVWEREEGLSVKEVCMIQIAKSLAEIREELKKK